MRRLTRADLMRGGAAALAGSLLPGTARAAEPRPETPAQARRRLARGNRRYVRRATHPHQGVNRRDEVAEGQHPFAIIFGCVDSRVPPEVVFDQGLGDLFVIRTAGEVLDDAVLGSIEYGILEIGIPLIVVLGHQRCGAVSAAIDAIEEGAHAPGHIDYLVEHIRPAVERGKTRPGDLVDNVVSINARMVAARLRGNEIVAEAVAAGRTKVVAARYELDNGRVEFL